ncbi:YdhR family protein [Shewanella marina]|uniref:YdhR family protein n=1 Tax=Shewanella marina TaxID=487319 RepID=UPI00277D1464|nr:YdhR family protein [Shewanella marina]
MWTESRQNQLEGGIYLFDNEVNAQAYLAKHTVRLPQMRITDIQGIVFDTNQSPTITNNGPILTTFKQK